MKPSNSVLGVFPEAGRRLAAAPFEVARFDTFEEAAAWLRERGVEADGQPVDDQTDVDVALELVAAAVAEDLRAWRDVTRGEVADRLEAAGVRDAWREAGLVLGRARELARGR